MQADDPPYLSVGTAVSAKYKGAFCEAKVSKVVRIVKCKVTYKMGLGTATVSDEQIKGTLRVGHTVQAKHPEKKEFVEATITKIQDCSQYTVVFDDGDITTLRRTALCLKSGRHFNESETLDQLPLTHPEHFGNPVVGGRRGRRNRQLKYGKERPHKRPNLSVSRDNSSDEEGEEETEPDLEGYTTDIGRVVSVEATDKKRGKDNWFPGLIVIPSAQPTVRINVKDEFLVRSFKDGRYYTVPKKEISEFLRDQLDKIESTVLAEAVGKALRYLDHNELPVHWERNSLFNMQPIDSDTDDNLSDSSDDGPNEEKDRFVAQLYKFMDDSGTPLNKSPMISNKDVDLHRLFRIVAKMGGYNRATNQNKWRTVTTRLKLPTNQITFNQVKSVYKKCLLSYEAFHRTLGVTMLNHTRSTKKAHGRSLIRDKDRITPVNSPNDDYIEKKEEKEEKPIVEEKPKRKVETPKEEIKKAKELVEMSDSSSSDAAEMYEPTPSTSREVGRPRRIDKIKDKKEKIKAIIGVEKTKPSDVKKEEEAAQQQTRSKSQIPKLKETVAAPPPPPPVVEKKKEVKPPEASPKPVQVKVEKKKVEEEKKRGRKRIIPDDKPQVEIITDCSVRHNINIGDKLKVYYGPTHESKVTYEAKVIEIDKDSTGLVFLVHYTGWNTRYDEWISPGRIAENLSANTKAKRLKQGVPSTGFKQSSGSKAVAGKRGRGMSITGRSTAEVPRSTTPSSVTSSSSRTKSPATPATRSSSRMTRLDYGRKTRRGSAQTDISNRSDSDSENSESEPELVRTRGSSRSEEIEVKTYKKRASKIAIKTDKSRDKDDADNEKSEESARESDRPRRTRKVKKSPEKSADESDEETGTNPPKGRDFDLNQIRSELKGFVKVPTVDSAEKEALSSSDDSNSQMPIKQEEKKDDSAPIEEPSSDDIYEFKEPEPFEFESRPKMADEKSVKKRIPRLFEDLEKSPKKKGAKSPEKSEKESPEPEKKRARKTSVRKQEDSDEDEDYDNPEDPFDKLVESPSFNLVKSAEKLAENKAVRNLMEPLSLFRELPETVDDYSHDMELSDCESQTQPIFSREANTLILDFPPKTEEQKKESEEFDSLRESITRAIERPPSSDEDPNLSDDDLLITPSTSSYLGKKRELEPLKESPPIIKPSVFKPDPLEAPKVEVKEEAEKCEKLAVQISPALQESDSALLEAISAQPVSIDEKLDETKDLGLKTGTKIADSILQKFNSIKNKTEKLPKEDSDSEDTKKDVLADACIAKLEDVPIKEVELKVKPSEMEAKKPLKNPAPPPEGKKKKKILSRAFIEESDSDSSDSEQLVIARSDEDSHSSSMEDKPDLKESDSNLTVAIETTDESQSQEEQRNFKFEKVEKSPSPVPVPEEVEVEAPKEEEPDSQLHSLLLCEETIPRSPAPSTEGSCGTEQKPKVKSVLEMPFASAPGSSSLNSEAKAMVPVVVPENTEQLERADAIDSPPPTPDSSISNLSPRGDPEEMSPNTAENESCKSNDAESDYLRKRRNSQLAKVPTYSEDDSQMTNDPPSGKKSKEDSGPGSCRKRRKSARSEDVPVKRGRKPLNRSRHNSDSDDTSDHSMSASAANLISLSYDKPAKSPRPSKYNFFVEFDPSLNSGQRIAVLQQKLSEIRKTYAEVKAELAAVERRRKKIRRREREALKASKQEMVCG